MRFSTLTCLLLIAACGDLHTGQTARGLPPTLTTIGNVQAMVATVGPDRTTLYTNEPPGTPPNVAQLVVPRNYATTQPLPLVILLHGLDGSSTNWSAQFGHRWVSGADRRGYFLLLPNGTIGPARHRHWNATDACCNANAGFPNRDDVGYLRDLILEAERDYRIDTRRVYVLGFSNGAFMSYRLACEIPQLITAIVPVSGATFQNEMNCVGTTPVSVLHIHGTSDPSVPFYDMPYDQDHNPSTPILPDRTNLPGAVQSLSRFAAKAGCVGGMTTIGNINIWHPHTENAYGSPRGVIGTGDETTVRAFMSCPTGYDFRLWEIYDGTHWLAFEYDLNLISDRIYPNDRIYDWMLMRVRN